MMFISKKISVKNRKPVKIDNVSIQSFEIINPLPVSYDEGISKFSSFTQDGIEKPYLKILDFYKPDVIHIHTLMGLHKSFLMLAHKKNIRVVFTAHDFFPICPKVTMFYHGEICKSVELCSDCAMCNANALKINKIKVLQSPIYRILKDFSLIKRIRKRHRDVFLGANGSGDNIKSVGVADDYKKLRMYYESMLRLVDIIHYNSSVTKSVYERFFELPNNCVIPITHSDIKDHKKRKIFSSEKIRIRYLGPQGGAKGFFVLRRHSINYGVKDIIFAWMSILDQQRCRHI